MEHDSPEPVDSSGAASSLTRATPRSCGLPDETVSVLEGAGFTVAGALSIDAYDALVPPAWRSDACLAEARQAIVLGTGGGQFERTWAAAVARERTEDPVDRLTRDVLDRATGSIQAVSGASARAWCSVDQLGEMGEEPVFADFVALAEACGLGWRSRIGLLLHPEYGPWWAVRGLILTSFAGGARVGADPSARAPGSCDGCAAPCVAACRGDAVSVSGFDAAGCARTRLTEPACADRCDARRACVVGAEHAHEPAAEAHYAAASLDWVRRAAAGPARA